MERLKGYLRTMPVLIAALVLLSAAGLAAVITHYGQMTGTVEVMQSVTVDGLDIGTGSLEIVDDGSVHSLKNRAGTDAVVTISTECTGPDDCGDEVVTEYHGVLTLSRKDTTTWQPVGDTITIHYTLAGDTFGYEVVDGTVPDRYELVYAMDKENRFNDYATVKTIAQVNDAGEGLPMAGDWNADADPDYCDNNNGYGDYYEHCVGAKLWLIPVLSFDHDTGEVYWDDMADFYWETDLVSYSDNTDGHIRLLGGGGGVSFVIDTEISPDALPGTYTLVTSVDPVL